MNYIARIHRWFIKTFFRKHPYCGICSDRYQSFCSFCEPLDSEKANQIISDLYEKKQPEPNNVGLTEEQKYYLETVLPRYGKEIY